MEISDFGRMGAILMSFNVDIWTLESDLVKGIDGKTMTVDGFHFKPEKLGNFGSYNEFSL